LSEQGTLISEIKAKNEVIMEDTNKKVHHCKLNLACIAHPTSPKTLITPPCLGVS
jgi:hypothetical protein